MDAGRRSADPELFDLLRRVARRDQAAFRTLYDQCGPHLFAVALRILKRRDLAEDVLQESFVSIWERAVDYDALRGAPLSWLATIVRHRSIDTLRRLGARPEGSQAGEEALAELIAGPGSAADRGAERRDLGRCLDQLEDQARCAVVYAYAYGYTHEELSRRLGAPLGTVKSWIRRSLDRLKLCLDP